MKCDIVKILKKRFGKKNGIRFIKVDNTLGKLLKNSFGGVYNEIH
jgi:hypothetical protein